MKKRKRNYTLKIHNQFFTRTKFQSLTRRLNENFTRKIRNGVYEWRHTSKTRYCMKIFNQNSFLIILNNFNQDQPSLKVKSKYRITSNLVRLKTWIFSRFFRARLKFLVFRDFKIQLIYIPYPKIWWKSTYITAFEFSRAIYCCLH